MSIELNKLPGDPGKTQKRKRIGRGESSGQGKTAGKGHKGQQARSGNGRRFGFEGGQTPLIRRIPKYGFTNISFRVPRDEVTLDKLNRFEDGDTVDLNSLVEMGLVKKSVKRVKVIATGVLDKKLTLKLQGYSKGARAAIEAKGGTCEDVAA